MKNPIERLPQEKHNQVIVIKLWEVYLRHHSENLYQVLSNLSMDNGPIQNYDEKERLTFRFESEIWEQRVKNLLYENRIPVVIQSNPLYAIQIKGGTLEMV
jgi:hypothetical protein